MYTKTMSDDNNYFGVILEEIRDQNKRVLEVVGNMQKQVNKIPGVEEDLQEIKTDIKVIKAAVVDTSNQVHDHEHRLTKLETA